MTRPTPAQRRASIAAGVPGSGPVHPSARRISASASRITIARRPAVAIAPLSMNSRSRRLKVSGVVPKDIPEGTDHMTYMAHAAAARIAAPQWTKEDLFVV